MCNENTKHYRPYFEKVFFLLLLLLSTMMNIISWSRVIHCMVTEVMQQLQCPCTKLCYPDANVPSAGDRREMTKGEQTNQKKKSLKEASLIFTAKLSCGSCRKQFVCAWLKKKKKMLYISNMVSLDCSGETIGETESNIEQKKQKKVSEMWTCSECNSSYQWVGPETVS